MLTFRPFPALRDPEPETVDTISPFETFAETISNSSASLLFPLFRVGRRIISSKSAAAQTAIIDFVLLLICQPP
jgi:hypothetical protein